VFLLLTVVGVAAGFVYAGFVDRRFGPQDWRRWAALAPFWVLAVGVALVLGTVNMSDLAPQAIQGFAVGSLFATVLDSLRVLRRRRAASSTVHDERAAPRP